MTTLHHSRKFKSCLLRMHLKMTNSMQLKWQRFSDRVENIVGGGENAGYQYFLHFLLCYKGLLQGKKKSEIFCKGLTSFSKRVITEHRTIWWRINNIKGNSNGTEEPKTKHSIPHWPLTELVLSNNCKGYPGGNLHNTILIILFAPNFPTVLDTGLQFQTCTSSWS